MLLQIMEEGHLSDAKGRKVDFRNTIIVMTSNIGADVIKHQTSIGFQLARDEATEEKIAYEEMRKKLLESLKRVFRPGFLAKVRRTSVASHYGIRTLLYGTLAVIDFTISHIPGSVSFPGGTPGYVHTLGFNTPCYTATGGTVRLA